MISPRRGTIPRVRSKRHDWLYDVTARPIKEHVLDLVAARLADAVESFPPSVDEWLDEAARRRYEPLLSPAPGRPGRDAVRCAIQLFRWEIEHDARAIDAWVRGDHGLDDDGLALAQFLSRYWLEETAAVKEYAKGKFKWHELAGLADRLEARLLRLAT
jgi:hypothetical protein